MKYIMVKGVAS